MAYSRPTSKMSDEREISRHRPADYRAPSLSATRELLFVTAVTKDRKAILARPEIHKLLRDTWQSAEAWLVGRYIIMPDHVHFFCAPGTKSHSLEDWMSYWKAAVTRTWPHPDEKPIWKRAFWDTRIRIGESYSAKWDYVRNNPVRAGLCAPADDWLHQGELNFLPW
jgi:putative transposase